jgi:hypothetical protein
MSSPLGRTQWRQVGLLTLAAAAVLLGLRYFRAGPEITHMDFVVGGPGSLEFCDPANPQFLPVVERSSPVSLLLRAEATPVADGPVNVVLLLWTNTGKAIGPRDLVLMGEQRMNLLIVDPDLSDFQAVQPTPGAQAGEWRFAFAPHRSGIYRIFADFTPTATGQEMYASADLAVRNDGQIHPLGLPSAGPGASGSVERDGLRLTLRPLQEPIHAREPAQLTLTMARIDGTPVSLQPIDGSLAWLVAFDEKRTGFVALHPAPSVPVAPGAAEVSLTFKVMIPDPGHYVIWSRIHEGRTEVAIPFQTEVVP